MHANQTQEQRQTQVISHELSEMFTNPFVDTNDEGWSNPLPANENDDNQKIPHENGDICNGQHSTITIGPNIWTVQKMYSKWHDKNPNGNNICLVGNPDPLPSLVNS